MSDPDNQYKTAPVLPEQCREDDEPFSLTDYHIMMAERGDREAVRLLLERFASDDPDPSLLAYMRRMAAGFIEVDYSGNKHLGEAMQKTAGLSGKRKIDVELKRWLDVYKVFSPLDENGVPVPWNVRQRNKAAMSSSPVQGMINAAPELEQEERREQLQRTIRKYLKD